MLEYDRDGVARANGRPADDAYMITPNNSQNLPVQVRAIRVANGGDLHVITYSGTERTLTLLDGEILTLVVRKVFATGTTASGLLGYV